MRTLHSTHEYVTHVRGLAIAIYPTRAPAHHLDPLTSLQDAYSL